MPKKQTIAIWIFNEINRNIFTNKKMYTKHQTYLNFYGIKSSFYFELFDNLLTKLKNGLKLTLLINCCKKWIQIPLSKTYKMITIVGQKTNFFVIKRYNFII